MREIRLYGSEGGGAERLFLPLYGFCLDSRPMGFSPCIRWL